MNNRRWLLSFILLNDRLRRRLWNIILFGSPLDNTETIYSGTPIQLDIHDVFAALESIRQCNMALQGLVTWQRFEGIDPVKRYDIPFPPN